MKESMSLIPGWLQTVKFGDIFIETGTGEGGGINEAYWAGFDHLVTIDKKFPWLDYLSLPLRTKLYWGDSPAVLRRILPDIFEPCTILLDAHRRGEPSPLSGELMALRRLVDFRVPHRILIDDMRRYRDGTWQPAQSTLEWFLKRTYDVQFADNKVAKDDILIATYSPLL